MKGSLLTKAFVTIVIDEKILTARLNSRNAGSPIFIRNDAELSHSTDIKVKLAYIDMSFLRCRNAVRSVADPGVRRTSTVSELDDRALSRSQVQ